MNIDELLIYARSKKCSDVHISENRNPLLRYNGILMGTDFEFNEQERKDMLYALINNETKQILNAKNDADFSYICGNNFRHRVNVFCQQGYLTASIRIINDVIPSFESLGLPEIIKKLTCEERGIVLVTGPTGSGKSTTLAAMIDYINANFAKHIITIENPIEYVYSQKKSLVNQREVGKDVNSFSDALRSSLREDPDVILVGEMRDFETISAAIIAADTGHLVLSTLHTVGASNTIDRIIDVFPSNSQQQIRTQLASTLKGVITQQLIEKSDESGRIAAFEVLVANDAVLNLIRDNKCYQLESVMQTGSQNGMITMDTYLKTLVMQGQIKREMALEKSYRKNEFRF